MATRTSPILRLSNELFRDILDYVEAEPDKLVNLDRRDYLSQESFKPPPKPSPSQAEDLASFRLTCKRFSELGAAHQFARVTTRFSSAGFARLRRIAEQKHLAQHVRKFSYMVPFFYAEGNETARRRLEDLKRSVRDLDIRPFVRKANDQDDIIQKGRDLETLTKAFGAFVSLQHVQILRVQDREDDYLFGYIRQNRVLRQVPDLRWPPACSHSTKTVGAALLTSRSRCSRFSSPMLSSQSAHVLALKNPRALAQLSRGLTSLELHFDEPSLDLDDQMSELSGLFKTVFENAEQMQAVHLGFPSHKPLSLPLETVFHHVKWEKLSAFGIQAWKLDAQEIIDLVRRHRERLRGLRLRDVLLKEGRWSDILEFLRNEMPKLDWVSLRRIGYLQDFEDMMAGAGFEVPDIPGGTSDSDEENALAHDYDDDDNDDDEDNGDDANDSASDISVTSDMSDQDSARSFDEDAGPSAHDISLPQFLQSDQRAPNTRDAELGQANASGDVRDLGDDGVTVTYAQRKMWERWVVESNAR